MSYAELEIRPKLRADSRGTINIRKSTKQEYDALKGDKPDWLFFEEVWNAYKLSLEGEGTAA